MWKFRLEAVSKVSDEDHDAGELEKAAVDFDKGFMTDERSPPITKPSEEPFDLPAFAVASQGSSILERLSFRSLALWADQPAIQMPHQFPQLVRVVGPVGDQSLRKAPGPLPAVLLHIHRELHFRGRSGGKRAFHKKTLAVRQHHPLRSFALLGFSNAEPPFLAGAKLPSMKYSCQSSRPCLSSCKIMARHRLSHTSFSSQSLNRRRQVMGLGGCFGTSRHLVPVFSTQRIPSNTSRSERRGRPKFSGSGSSSFHQLPYSVCHEFVAHASFIDIACFNTPEPLLK
jgi:hypothetical protein